MPVIPVLRKLRQEDTEFEMGLSCFVSTPEVGAMTQLVGDMRPQTW